MKKKRLFLLFIFVSTALFAKVDLELSHDIASIDDTLTLTYSLSEQTQQAIPSFSRLKENFNILSTSQSSQISIINGHVKRQYIWQVLINAKKSGTLTIPPIKFGNESSPSQKVTIKKEGSSQSDDAHHDLFMTASVDIKSPYVQQQIVYQVKLFYKRPPSSGEFTAPSLENATLTPIGKSKNYRTEINNEAYNVAEQNFVISPSKSGPLTLSSPLFTGTLRRNNIHDINQLLMDVQQPIKVSAPKITLNIKPIPSHYTGKIWLPAKQLTLEESFDKTQGPLPQGEPFTRIIKIKALGLMGNQLPEFTFSDIPGSKIYPEPSITHDENINLTVASEKTFKVVYIPTGTENITLPELTLSWWNTTTNKSETLTLKERSFTVQKTQTKNTSVITKKTIPTPLETARLAPEKTKKTSINFQDLLPWCLVFLLCIALLKKHFFGDYKIKRKKPAALKINKTLSPRQLKNEFKKACMDNEPRLSCQYLIKLSQLKWPHALINQLADIPKNSNDEPFNIQVARLQKALYSAENHWEGKALWQAFLALKLEIKKNKKEEALPKFN